jgi:predicted DNA-binding transcriptional regulator AlpA
MDRMPAETKSINRNRFITEIEFEADYAISRRTLQKWRSLGRGPVARKFGSLVRYDVTEIEAWIATLPTIGGPVPE